ncbi:ADP-ribosylation factor-binding protein GGA1-like isoform X2 [Tachypleus tridentatus]|uniref:ADP-ribosylation factor-binding protein GGA1-like isoform X2 n=1 Tax=Tachypleus tridentatus TaxID=6853 RepID=UPI003FD21DED
MNQAKSINPLNSEPNKESVIEFCDKVNKEEDGHQIALRFLVHKIQSPQEREALHSLTVIEECIKRCDSKFCSEIGKFKFLNELIKVVSPKYLGNRASPKVKTKVIELMFKWSVELKQEPKIFEAYQMLKRQGVVTEDPVHVLKHQESPDVPPSRAKNAFFEDEQTSQTLQKLLSSRNPEDLQAANRLIKDMVKEADRRMELSARRNMELETVHNNAKVLNDMLYNYQSKETTADENELMKELFDSCERLRPKLFKLAGELDEKDEGLESILKANDNLTTVINIYKKLVLGQDVGPVEFIGNRTPKSETTLLDLVSLTETRKSHDVDSRLLDDQLLALGLNDGQQDKSTNQSASSLNGVKISSHLDDLDQLFCVGGNSKPEMQTSEVGGNFPGIENSSSITVKNATDNNLLPFNSGSSNQMIATSNSAATVLSIFDVEENVTSGTNLLQPLNAIKPPVSSYSQKQEEDTKKATTLKGLEELDMLGQSLLKKSLPTNSPSKSEFSSVPQKIPLNQLHSHPPVPTPGPPSVLHHAHNSQDISDSPSRTSIQEVLSLAGITIPLHCIQPGETPPLTLNEKNGLTTIVHFGKDSPRKDVIVMVVSTMSRNPRPVKNFSFQAAVPKVMKVKLQPPSATDLPSYNPILPPAAITQVMLLANPNKEKAHLKYKITYIIEGQTHTDIGEVYNLLERR